MENPQYHVLLVEEREADAQLIEESLLQSTLPVVVTHVRRLSDALEQCLNTDFDLLLLDLFLTDSRGLDTFVAMRSHAPRLPMILLTDSSSIDITSEAAKKGAQDVLNKDEINPAILEKTALYAIQRKRHEQELYRQKEFYENLLHDANVWVEALDRAGNVILWNRGAEDISGYSARAMMHSRKRWEVLFPDKDVQRQQLEHYRFLLTEARSVKNEEGEIHTAQGETRVISWSSNIIKGENGETVGCMFVGNDVTARRESVRAISRSEDRFRILAELTSDYVYSASISDDMQVTTDWVEGAFQQITGFAPEDVIGNPDIWWDLMHPDDNARAVSVEQLLDLRGPVVFDYRILRPDKTVIWVRDHIKPVMSEGGKVVGLHGAVQDITERRRMEDSLLKEQEKLRGVIENSADGIAVIDEKARVIEWSPAMEKITGISRSDAIGRYHWDIQARLALPEEHEEHDVREYSRQELETYLREGSSPWVGKLFDRWIVRPDGERRFIEMVSFPVRSSQGLLTGSVSRDITEVKLAEIDIEEKNRQLQTLIQAIPDLVYFKDGSLRNIIANQAYADYVGHEIGDVIDKLDREILPVDIAKQCEKSDRDVIENGQPVRREEVTRNSTDGSLTYFETLKVPLRDADGNVTGLVGVSRDITERKVAELLLEQQNKQLKERNQELDTYTYSVAHDLKNPLSLILGYAELVQTEHSELSPEELNTYMNSVLFNGRKMISIINSLLLLASVRQEDVTLEYLDMHQIVDDAVRRLQRSVAEQEVSIVMPENWLTAMGYATWIEEVWVNYIGNAIKYGGKHVHIEIGMKDEGEMIRYSVADNGPGIPKESLKEIFAPFTRLSQANIEGHGLGLSIVRRIVEKIGGSVGVDSEPGKGATFYFTLPKG